MWHQHAEVEDAWGSEDEGSTGTPGNLPRHWTAPVKQPAVASKPPVVAPRPARPAAAAPPSQELTGPDSLHSICLGVLGEHLQDLLEDPVCQQDILPLLPSEVKACLLAVARLRRLLCDTALLLLADEGQAVLDLHGCGDLVSDDGIREAVRRMPQLARVDLTSCHVSSATLRTLGECCPAVELLRLGSSTTDASGASGMKDVLPMLEQRQQAPAADSWDALLEVDDVATLSAAVAGRGRLMQLQCLTWPNIPFRLAEHCRAACPKVALNPSADAVAALRLPPACDPSVQLDAPLLAEVSGSVRWEQAQAPQEHNAPVIHIAEKFRMAYISRAARVKAKMERNWQQQRRREIRQASAAEHLIRQWEGEL